MTDHEEGPPQPELSSYARFVQQEEAAAKARLADTQWRWRAWQFSAIMGVATYVAALVVVVPRETNHTNASVAGGLLVPVVLAVVAAALIAMSIKGRWRVLVPWVATPLLASIVIAVTHGDDLRDSAKAREEASHYTRSHIVISPRVMGWHEVRDPAMREQAERAVEALESRDPTSETVYGSYVRGARTMALFATNTGEGGSLREELERSPRQSLDDFLGGSGITGSQPVATDVEGIALACAEYDDSTVVCAWADLTTLGTATWRFADVDIEQAAGLTDDLLGEVRVVDE